MYTSSVVGHHQEAVVVDAERLPVQGRMCLQSLVMQETASLNIPLVDNGQFRLHLPGIRHHHEDLNKKRKVWLDNSTEIVSVCLLLSTLWPMSAEIWWDYVKRWRRNELKNEAKINKGKEILKWKT